MFQFWGFLLLKSKFKLIGVSILHVRHSNVICSLNMYNCTCKWLSEGLSPREYAFSTIVEYLPLVLVSFVMEELCLQYYRLLMPINRFSKTSPNFLRSC